MFLRSAIGLMALCVPPMAASQFLLGVDYLKPSGQWSLSTLVAVSTDAQGNAYVANGSDIFKYTASGQMLWHVFVSTGIGPTAMAADAAGNVYLLVGASLQRISSDGNGVTSLLDFGIGVLPKFIAIDAGNRIWVANPARGRRFIVCGSLATMPAILTGLLFESGRRGRTGLSDAGGWRAGT